MRIQKHIPIVQWSIQSVTFFIIFFLVLFPIFFLIYQSFLSAPIGTPGQFTLEAYICELTSPYFLAALSNTFTLAFGVLAIALPIGVITAFIITRTDVPFKSYLEILIIIPIFISPLVTIMGWVMLLSPGGYITYFLKSFGLNVPDIYTLEAMIVFISLYLTSHIFLFLSSAFKSMDLTLEESSRISGANIIRTAFKITIPLMRPALIFSSILTFILAIEQFSVPFILGLKKGIYTLTTYLYTLEVGIGEVAMEMRFSRMAVGAVITILIAIFLTSLQRKLIKDPYRFVTITARGYQPKVIKLGSLKYLAFIICFGFFFISVIIPIFTLVYRSFLTSWAPYANQLELFTLNNYINLFYIPTALIALRNSIFISITGALIAAFLTSIASYIIFRSEFFGRKQLDYVCTLPASIPGVIMGIGFLMAWLRFPIGIYGTIWCLVIVYITRFLTSGVRSSSSSLLQISKEHEDSAKILGASWIQIFLKILLPLMKQGIIAGWLLMFISMMNELSASIFLAPPGSPVLMVYMIDLWEYGNTGIMSALAIIQILLSFIIIIFFRRLWGIKLYA